MPLLRSVAVNLTLQATQTWASPTVYLDHWAVRKLTDELPLQERFVRAIHEGRGTLALSPLNVVEFAAITDPRHAQETERFLDRVIPHIFFLSLDQRAVLRQELATDKPQFPFPPPTDVPMLTDFVVRQTNFEKPLSFHDFFQSATGIPALEKVLSETKRSITDAIDDARRDPLFSNAAETFNAHTGGAPALTVIRELLRIPVNDPQRTLDPNDGADLLHTIIPLAYCDFLLLDKRWTDFCRRVKDRLRTLGIDVRLAEVYSARSIEDFLVAFERFSRK